MIELRLPSFGADMDDAAFVEWRVQPGDAVARGQVVCVVETQKGAIDVEAWQAGTMARLVAEAGQRLPVGSVLALLAGEGEDWQAVAAAASAPVATPAPTPAAIPAPKPTSEPTPELTREPPAAAVAGPAPALRASPAARKRAAEIGVDLARLPATGKPLTLADVEAAAAARTDRLQEMRAAIAAAMSRSKREIPHYYLGCEAPVDAAQRWLADFNAQRPVAERVLFPALMLKAVALALAEAPELNGFFLGGRFQPAESVHLGVVTALRGGGLMVPTVHDAQRLTLADLMAALREAIERARRGQLRSSDLADSTVTVSNLGDLGTDVVYGVIYPPQVALVGLGRVAPRPVVQDGRVVALPTVHLTLAADHRASDGLVGARFLAALTERLARPEGLP